MGRNPFLSKEFKDLQNQWYQKLEESGFSDVEDVKGRLKEWHSSYLQTHYKPTVFYERLTYFEIACEILHTHDFESEIEKMIWEFHSEGLTLREISKKLELKVWFVHRVVNKLSTLIYKKSKS